MRKKTYPLSQTILFTGMLIVCVLAVGVPRMVFGQNLNIGKTVGINSQDVTVELTPEIPPPNSKVTVELSSLSFDIENANITWFRNGNRKVSGYGKAEVNFTSGDIGESTTLKAVIDRPNSQNTITKTITISPAELDMLWEAKDVYTPPFYKGKALPSPESTIRVVALPGYSGISVNSSQDLSTYRWERNFEAQPEASGFNASSYTIRNNYLNNNETIRVRAKHRSTSQEAQETITIPMQEPDILVSRRLDDGRKIYSDSSVSTDKSRLALSLEPLFMSVNKRFGTKPLSISWNVEGAKRDILGPSLNIQTAELGNTDAHISVEHPDTLLQNTDRSIRFIFE